MKITEFILSSAGLLYAMWTSNPVIFVICGLNTFVTYKRMMKEMEVQA